MELKNDRLHTIPYRNAAGILTVSGNEPTCGLHLQTR